MSVPEPGSGLCYSYTALSRISKVCGRRGVCGISSVCGNLWCLLRRNHQPYSVWPLGISSEKLYRLPHGRPHTSALAGHAASGLFFADDSDEENPAVSTVAPQKTAVGSALFSILDDDDDAEVEVEEKQQTSAAASAAAKPSPGGSFRGRSLFAGGQAEEDEEEESM